MSEFQQHSITSQGGIGTRTESPTTAPPAFGQSAAEGQPSTQPITKRQEVCRVAAEMFRQNPDWVAFFREVLGVEGVARRVFSKAEELEAFEKTEEYAKIQSMVAKLRENSRYQSDSDEPTRVITVRLPKSLHESLKAESYQRRTSMNQLCISKLLQIIGNDLIPSD